MFIKSTFYNIYYYIYITFEVETINIDRKFLRYFLKISRCFKFHFTRDVKFYNI